MKANGLSVLVLEKAKKKFAKTEESNDSKFALTEASQKVHSAFKGDDADELGQALSEFFDIYSSQPKD